MGSWKTAFVGMHPEAPLINNWLDSLEYSARVTWKALANLSENTGADLFRKEFEKLRPRYPGGTRDQRIQLMMQELEMKEMNKFNNLKAQ